MHSTIKRALSSPKNAYRYALEVIRGRFPEAEPVIAQYGYWALWYARDVIKGRWVEAEPVIAQDPKCAADYYNKFYDQFTEQERVFWLLKI